VARAGLSRRWTGPDATRGRPSRASAPDDCVADGEEQQRLLAAVAGLTQAQREVVVLRLSAELKFAEIADLLHVPLGTALSRMHAAVRQLRRELGYVDVRW